LNFLREDHRQNLMPAPANRWLFSRFLLFAPRAGGVEAENLSGIRFAGYFSLAQLERRAFPESRFFLGFAVPSTLFSKERQYE
jgi:hypothetical protein